jgi:hypothetical protein
MLRRSTLALLIFFLVLLAGTLYWQKTKLNAPASPTATVATQFLFETKGSLVKTIQISGPEGKAIILEKYEPDKWQVKTPQTSEADSTKIESVLGQLDSIRVLSTPELLSSLSQLGLDPPTYGIVIQLEDGRQLIANIGKSTPTGSGYYVLTGDRYVVVVNKGSLDPIIGLLANPPFQPTPTVPTTDTPGPLTATP